MLSKFELIISVNVFNEYRVHVVAVVLEDQQESRVLR